MSSLVDRPELIGFFSYSRQDDEDAQGALTALRDRIQRELRGQLGRSPNTFRIWQDKEAIPSGSLWEAEIKTAVSQAVFFVPIITPTVVGSPYCQFELNSFLTREAALGRSDLVFPLLYIRVPALEDSSRAKADPVLSIIAQRQYLDWREFRHRDVNSPELREAIERFCAHIANALSRSWVLPEEREKQEQAAALQRAEDERRRQDAERQAETRSLEAQEQRKAEAQERDRAEQERRLREAETREQQAEEKRRREAEAKEQQAEEKRRREDAETKRRTEAEEQRRQAREAARLQAERARQEAAPDDRPAVSPDGAIQISQFLDRRGFGRLQLQALVWSALLGIFAYYDLAVFTYALAGLRAQWSLSPSDISFLAVVGLVGLVLGGPIFGWLGDRYGRKTALIGSSILFGVLTFFSAFTPNVVVLALLRFGVGLGIGGVYPNALAINIECAPRHLRATLAMIAYSLFALGGLLSFAVSAALVARFGWNSLFIFGGLVPMFIAIVALFGLPDSIKSMALRGSQQQKLRKLIATTTTAIDAAQETQFVIEDEKQPPSLNLRYLFRGELRLITPLTWLMAALVSFGYFALAILPSRLMSQLHETGANILPVNMAFLIGAVGGGLILCWWVQQQGFLAIGILLGIAVPVMGLIGLTASASTAAVPMMTFLAAALVTGIRAGLYARGAMLYPTSLRASGSGWQVGFSQLGFIVSSLTAVFFAGVSIGLVYLLSAVPLAAAAIVSFIIHKLNTARPIARDEWRQDP